MQCLFSISICPTITSEVWRACKIMNCWKKSTFKVTRYALILVIKRSDLRTVFADFSGLIHCKTEFIENETVQTDAIPRVYSSLVLTTSLLLLISWGTILSKFLSLKGIGSTHTPLLRPDLGLRVTNLKISFVRE